MKTTGEEKHYSVNDKVGEAEDDGHKGEAASAW